MSEQNKLETLQTKKASIGDPILGYDLHPKVKHFFLIGILVCIAIFLVSIFANVPKFLSLAASIFVLIAGISSNILKSSIWVKISITAEVNNDKAPLN